MHEASLLKIKNGNVPEASFTNPDRPVHTGNPFSQTGRA